jgi:hypothetical protein
VGRRGRKPQLDLESQYWKLLRSGVGTVAASKLLGIGRKTATGGEPRPAVCHRHGWPSEPRSGRYLSLLERQRIATPPDRGLGVREIARRLGRFPSTVSRKLRRHLRPHDRGIYDGDLAHARPRERSRRPDARCWPASRSCRGSCRTSSRRSGVRRRSRRTCATRIPTARRGICATRPPTRRSTTAGKVG